MVGAADREINNVLLDFVIEHHSKKKKHQPATMTLPVLILETSRICPPFASLHVHTSSTQASSHRAY